MPTSAAGQSPEDVVIFGDDHVEAEFQKDQMEGTRDRGEPLGDAPWEAHSKQPNTHGPADRGPWRLGKWEGGSPPSAGSGN